MARPSDYTEAYCTQLITHMEEGLSFESFAGAIGVCKQTLYNWIEQYPEFLDAKKAGFEKSRLTWERIGLKIAKNGEGNPTAFIFNMKNRFKDEWKDKVETGFTDGEGKDVSPVQIYIPDNGRDKTTSRVSGESSL
jgi:hypothetical protein